MKFLFCYVAGHININELRSFLFNRIHSTLQLFDVCTRPIHSDNGFNNRDKLIRYFRLIKLQFLHNKIHNMSRIFIANADA